MMIRCVWEHNGNDSLLYSDNFIGAFTRGQSMDIALGKMGREIASYRYWLGQPVIDGFEIEIVQEKASELAICDADSDVLFDSERAPLTMDAYAELRALVLKSAEDFHALYEAIPDKERSCLQPRKTFYGQQPCTAKEMYQHTKNVNEYYFGEIGIDADNEGTIYTCRKRGFDALERTPDFLNMQTCKGSYDEEWSLRKVLRRFLWHDRIHAKAMYRMAVNTFGKERIPDIFRFGVENR